MKTLQSRDDNRAEILHDGSVCVGLCEDYKEGERSCCPVCLKQLIAKRYQTTKVHLQLPGGAQPWLCHAEVSLGSDCQQGGENDNKISRL